MGEKRDVVNLLSIFELTICKALDLPESVSTRVMFVYDKKEKIKQFTVLNNGITEDINSKIASWLEENVDVLDIISGLRSNEMDADNLPRKASPL